MLLHYMKQIVTQLDCLQEQYSTCICNTFTPCTQYAMHTIFRFGSTLIIDCELSAGNVVTVFFAVIIGSFSLGNALPEIQTFATALGSATAVFKVIDRVSHQSF